MTRKERTQRMLAAVETAIMDISAGAASASVSSGNGSKSYTRADLGTLYRLRQDLRQELRGYNTRGRPAITMTGANFV